ncbi:MAG: GspMb/PilO family protein [bacterium]
MKARAMSTRDRRAVTVGLAILVPSLLFVWGVKPYFAAVTDAKEQLSVERETLARERAAIDAARRNPKLRDRADSAMRAVTPRLFEGRDDVMASAELTSYLGEVAREHRVWLQDAATRPAVQLPGGVRALRVELRAESDLRGVLSMLRALESGAKLVRVDRLDISRVAKVTADDASETLAVSATVMGYAKGVPSAPATPSSVPPQASTSSPVRGGP